jgi:hypothetical protein
MSDANRERESSPEFERITPVSLRMQATSARHERRIASNWLAWSAFGILLIAATGVFFVLPNVAQNRAPPGDSMQASAPPAAKPMSPSPPAPATQSPTPRGRMQAERELARLENKQSALTKKGVHLWGGPAWDNAKAQAARGDELFVDENFKPAAQAYARAARMTRALADKADTVLAAAIKVGQAALEHGNHDKAAKQFELALTVQAGNDQAEQGLARARNLAEVLELLDTAARHAAQGALQQAATAYRKAAEIDPAFAPAQEGLADIERQINDRQFSDAMSQGFAALAREDFTAARHAFESARELKPGAAAATDGLAQVDASIRLQKIAAHKDQAKRLEDEEKWREAAKHYGAAQKLDPNLVFAKDGLARSLARAQLAEGLNFHIAHPARLSAESVYASAASLLEQARAIAPQGPKLRQQSSALSELLRRAATPVPVRLRSDNLTEVTVYHVGALGRFDTQKLELRPGTYTAVGSRDGYRDVRRKFTVVAGESPATVVVRCLEQI